MAIANPLDHALVEAYSPLSGRLDALRLAEQLAISTRDMADMVGYTPQGLKRNPDSKNLQERLTKVITIITLLRRNLGNRMDLVRIWLNAPHPDLDNHKPLEVMRTGRLDIIETMAIDIDTGQPG